jgi:hypothetical protein
MPGQAKYEHEAAVRQHGTSLPAHRPREHEQAESVHKRIAQHVRRMGQQRRGMRQQAAVPSTANIRALMPKAIQSTRPWLSRSDATSQDLSSQQLAISLHFSVERSRYLGGFGSLAVTVRELLRGACRGLVYLGQMAQQQKIGAELVMQPIRVIPHHL